MRYNVNLGGYVPRIGSGWRVVELLTLGHKWATIRYQPKGLVDGEKLFTTRGKVHKDVWAKLPKKELDDLT